MTNNITLSKEDRLMVLAVHPDDETLGSGGLLQQAIAVGAAVRIVFVTNGDNNPWPQRLMEGHWYISDNDRARWGMRRRGEALAALAALKVDIKDAVFLELPDQGITSLLTNGDERVLELLAEEFRWKPSVLIVPALEDQHPDHNAVAVLADLALQRLPQLEAGLTKFAYLIHGRQVYTAARYSIKLTPQQLDNKRQAILCHHTQAAFGQRRFLRYAKAEETFFSSQPAELYRPMHPLERVSYEDSLLKVSMRITGLISRFARLALSLVVEHPQRCIHLRLVFKRNSYAAGIIDSTNGNLVGQANINIKNNLVEAVIPLEGLSDAENIYLKLEHRWGFFDLAGWRRASIKAAATRPAVNIVGIIPCYDVEDYCEGVILRTINYVDHIIAIDDGSTDNTSSILAKLAAMLPERISVISFPRNHGKGVGLIAGFCEALNRYDFKTLVTLDADGQHPPAEIPNLVAMMENGAGMAMGGRQLEQMPGRSRLGNTLATSALRWFYPQAPDDTQSGLRAFDQAFVWDIVNEVRGSRYETEFQILLLALSQRRQIVSVPIPTIYIDNNRSSKFRPITDSLTIFLALVRWRLRHA